MLPISYFAGIISQSGGTPPPPSQPSASFLARASGANVVWSHNFDVDTEVTAHLKGTIPADESPGWTKRVIDGDTGQPCLESLVIGAGLIQDFTAGGTTMVIDDIYGWPDPAVEGSFVFIAHQKYPAVENAPSRNIFRCTARSGNVLTVTLDVSNGFGATTSTPLSFTVGDYVGYQELSQWNRVFSALPAGENGKATPDQAASGAVPLRSRVATGTYGVPRDLDLWQYGWYGHPENVTRWQNWTRWFGASQYPARGVVNGPEAKHKLWDGNEFWIQFRVKVDPRFFQYHDQPDTDSRTWGRKAWGIQSEVSCPQQLVTGLGASNRYGIPDTAISPFGLYCYKAARTIGVNDQTLRVPGSPQLGSPWDVAPQYANATPSFAASSGFATPDGSPAWEMKSNEWITFQVRVRPGRSFQNDTLIEVKFARTEDPNYTGAYTTLLSASDAQVIYGNSKDNEYPNGDITYPDTGVMDTLPGYQSFILFSYLNMDLGSAPPRRSYSYRLGQVIFSRAEIPAPTADASTGYTGKPRFFDAQTYSTGNTLASTISNVTLGKKINLGPGPNVGIVARVVSWGSGSNITSVTVGGVALTATAQRALTGFSANERLFYLAGSALKDYQSWSVVQADAASRLIVEFYVVRNCTAITPLGTIDVASNTLSQSVATGPNSIVIGMLTSSTEPCMTQATGSSLERLGKAETVWGKKSFVLEVDASTGTPSLTALRTGPSIGAYAGQTLRLTGQTQTQSWPFTLPASGTIGTISTNVLTGVTDDANENFSLPKILGAWCTAAVSLVYSGSVVTDIIYWMFGGGHGDTANDAVYAWRASTGLFYRPLAPSAAVVANSFVATTVIDVTHGENIYGRPDSQHTYGHLQGLDSNDTYGPALMQVFGSAIGQGATGSSQAHRFDGTTWERWANVSGGSATEVAMIIKDTQRKLFLRFPSDNYSNFYSLDYTNNSVAWLSRSQIGRTGGWSSSYCAFGTYDPVRDFYIGGIMRGVGFNFRALSAATPTGAWTELTFTVNAAYTTITTATRSGGTFGGPGTYALGIYYRAIDDTFVMIDNTTSPPTGIWVLTPPASNPLTNPWTWSRRAFTGTSNFTSIISNGEHYDRFQYVAAIDSFIVCSSSTTQMEVWKL